MEVSDLSSRQKVRVHAYRADDVFKPGVIFEDIVRGLKTADVVIAEVSSHNPNVFYEIGYAHCAGTPLILMAEKKQFEEKRLPLISAVIGASFMSMQLEVSERSKGP